MRGRNFSGVAAVALGMTVGGPPAFSQAQPPSQGPAVGGTPAWFLQGSFPDPGGRTVVEPGGHVTVSGGGGGAGGRGATPAPVAGGTPGCTHSPLCGNRLGPGRQALQRVEWKQTLDYTFTYPYVLPPGYGGVPAVALDSKENLWAFQRAAAGKPQLFKFDSNHKLILQVGEDVIGYQEKAHGMAVDAADNVWICDAAPP